MATKADLILKLQADINSDALTLDEAKAWAMAVNALKDLNSFASVSGDANLYFGVDAGSTDAYAIAVTGYTAYVNGDTFIFIANTENTGVASLNITSLGSKTLKKSFNQDLETGDIVAGQIIIVSYDGTNDCFQLLGGSSGSFIAKATATANSILYAVTNATPAALTLAASQVVGRKATGDIVALSMADLQAMLFSTPLQENIGIELDTTLSADGKYCGITESGTAGATLAFGDLCYFNSSSKWVLTDADAESTASGKLGICVLAATGDGEATKILLYGKVRADSKFPTFTVGGKVFVSCTAGEVTQTAPSGSADIVRVVGYANTADELYFFPSPDYFELA